MDKGMCCCGLAGRFENTGLCDVRGSLTGRSVRKGMARLIACAVSIIMIFTGAAVNVCAKSAYEYPREGASETSLMAAVAAVAAVSVSGGGTQAANALHSVVSAGKDAAAMKQVSSSSSVAVKTENGGVNVKESVFESGAAELKKRVYSGAGIGDCTVYMERLSASGEDIEAQVITTFALGEGEGTLRSYDSGSGKWTVTALSEGVLPYGMYFISTGSVSGGSGSSSVSESIFITPQTYEARENGMIEAMSDYNGSLTVSKQDGRYFITVSAPALKNGMFCDFTALCSESALVDWNNTDNVKKWENYRFTDDNRWCYDGYYYKTPSNYIPSGNGYFYKLPAAHITGKMAKNKDDAASRAFALTMLDVMHDRYTESGYIPSENGSQWLKSEYNIDAGYYDTRFNTDIALAMLNAGENFGAPELIKQAEKYGKFLLSHAANRHYTFGSGAYEGWLVDDYWHENGKSKRTHVSLNHHTAEAVFLYRLADATGDETYAKTAEKMVRGIEYTADKWIMPDGNLYYSYGSDGNMITGDYPYLTYNDLLELQKIYTKRYGAENSAIAKLMSSKLAWMNQNGVTGYNK